MKKICVLGAGTMGLEIAQAFAVKGYDVTVRDIKDEILDAAKAKMVKGLEKKVSKGRMTDEVKATIEGNMHFTTDMKALADMDLIVEAILERMDIKKSVFAELDEICKPETIFASNTSSLSVTEVGTATNRQDKVIGMHFFNPATVMKLVELIRTVHTSDETYKVIEELTKDIDKTPVEVQEAPGFVVNKILIPMVNEAVCVLQEGVASVEDINTAMKLGANHPMGPLALGDLIGWDIVLNIMDVLYNETHDSKYRANPLIRKWVRGGILGNKNGKTVTPAKK